MVSRRDLSADPARRDAARFRRAAEAGRQLATAPHGVTDLGDGDILWTGADGRHSVRDLPASITGLEDALAAGLSTTSRLNTVSTLAPSSTEDYPEDAYWTQIGIRDGKRVVIGTWQLTNGGWQEIGEDASRLTVGQIDVGLIDVAMVWAEMIEAGSAVIMGDRWSVDRTNLCENSRVSSAAGWSRYQGRGVAVFSPSLFAAYDFARTIGDFCAVVPDRPNLVPGGGKITIGCTMWSDEPGIPQGINLVAWDASNNVVFDGYGSAGTAIRSSAARFVSTYDVPATAVRYEVRFRNAAPSTQTQKACLVKSVTIEQGSSFTDGSYFYGSTAATASFRYRFTGAANSSTSVREARSSGVRLLLDGGGLHYYDEYGAEAFTLGASEAGPALRTGLDSQTHRRTILDNGGLRIEYTDPETGQVVATTDVGNGGDDRITLGAPGSLESVALDGASGSVGAKSASFGALSVAGATLAEHLDTRAKGVIKGGFNVRWDGTLPLRKSRAVLLRNWVTLEPNRQYRITTSGFKYANQVNPTTVDTFLVHRWNDSQTSRQMIAPTTSSGSTWNTANPAILTFNTGPGSVYYTATPRLCAIEYAFQASDLIQVVATPTDPVQLLIEDIGPWTLEINNYDTWSSEGSGGTGTTPGAGRTTVSRLWGSVDAAAYWASNGSLDGTYSPRVPIQGTWDGASSNLRFGLWAFPNLTGELAGATINAIDIEVTPTYWPWAPGVVRFALHGQSGIPASMAIGALTDLGEVGGAYAGAPVRLSLPASRFAGFLNGAYRGIAVYTGHTAGDRYGRLSRDATITINYTK